MFDKIQEIKTPEEQKTIFDDNILLKLNKDISAEDMKEIENSVRIHQDTSEEFKNVKAFENYIYMFCHFFSVVKKNVLKNILENTI